MKKIFNNYFFNILIIVLIGGLVVFLTGKAFGNEIFEVLRNVDYWYIVIALLTVLGYQFIIGYVLTLLTRLSKPDYKVSSGIVNGLVASLFHGITPSSTGGQIAQFFVYRKQGVDAGDAGSVLWMEFIIYQSCLTLVSLFFIIVKFPYFYSSFSSLFIFVIFGFILNASIIVMMFLLAKFKRLHEWIADKGINIGYKLHLIKDKENTADKVEKQLECFRNEVANICRHKKILVKCSLLCIIRLLMYYSVPFFVFASLGYEINLSLLYNAIAMGSFVAIASGMIPIPGASGGTEVIFIMMFSNLFGSSLSASAMIIWRFMTYYLILMLGTAAFGYIKLKR